ncbi:spermidine dehydrogenase [Wohlfahrtiimonas chitiniclastica]|uniref:NAD(P)-binding protein n=1 Tax=Wohlfahrtiimonas chitiniclastica TaxID=400946 RepID=UPI000B9956DE|nr:NAD(P)/FAD-dependent oxidoreductase [Wohlfahrtiimonas chitiniclastica]OYQ69255.1 spermidine dehydrogenase [Wohlfahrtiimonas chitiniclastica]
MPITRRDFLNGVALTIATGLTPLQQLANASEYIAAMANGEDYYPPKLTGLRGSHNGSFEVAHRLGRAADTFDLSGDVEETYDLIIVGAGISGLAAAHRYLEVFGENQKILILDNHDDFGGHAKRNEFVTEKGTLLTYGGSESLQSPRSVYSAEATDFIQKIGVDLTELEAQFDVNFYPDLGLSRGIYFDQKHFGRHTIVAGDPSHNVADDVPRGRENGRPYAEFVADFPVSSSDKAALLALYEDQTDYLAEMTPEEKTAYLDHTSYRDFLRDRVKLSDQAILVFQQVPHDFMAVGIDAISCSDARACTLPGFGGMNLEPLDEEAQAAIDDLYIHHFPDGNASLARLAVRRLIPAVANGKTMHDVVNARFDYDALDRAEHNVRIRLNSTVIHVEHNDDQATEVVYYRDGKAHKVKANATIMACYNMMIPFIVPSLPEAQKAAMRRNVKAPLVYTKVALRDWSCFVKAGVSNLYCPSSPYSTVKLDYPVSMGGYTHAQSPSDPVVLHMIYVPTMPSSGLPATRQAAMGRAHLLGMTFEDHETIIREQLGNMFTPYGFQQSDIVGITVNRWSHGYAYYPNSLFDDEAEFEALMAVSKAPFGNIFIANSDSEWGAYAHAAIDAAYRTVDEIKQGRA